MAFSFRNLFKKDEEIEGGDGSPQPESFDAFGNSEVDPAYSAQFSGGEDRFNQNPPALPVTVPAGQIIPHLPRELANPNGISPDAMVRLPAADESGGLKLIEIYQACPALFSYAPDIRDNRTVVIGVHAAANNFESPFATQGQELSEASPFFGAQSSSAPATSPFSPTVESAETGRHQAPAWQSANNPVESNALAEHPVGYENGNQPPANQPAYETGFLPQNQGPGTEAGTFPQNNPQEPSLFETRLPTASEQEPPHQYQQPHPQDTQPTPQHQGALFNPPTGQTESPPARPVTQELDASALPFAPAPPPEMPDEPGEIELSLLNLLRGVPQEDLGFDPEEVPPDVRTTLPIAMIRPQLSSGKVVLPLTEIVAGCEERFHKAFANSREGVQVPLPLQEIFHNLPGDFPEGPSTAELVARDQAEGAPIYDPSAPEQVFVEEQPSQPEGFEAPWDQIQPTAPAIPEAFAGLVTPPPEAPEEVAESYPEPEPVAASPEPSPSYQSDPPASAPSFFVEEEEPAQVPVADQLAASPFGTPGEEGGLSSEQLLGSPFRPVEHSGPAEPPFTPISSPATTPTAGATAPSPEPSTDFAAFDQQTDLDQLALRAIFQVDKRLTPQDVLDFCCHLPDVGACVALHPGGALTAGDTSGSGFGEDAAGMFENVAGLARGLGIGEADTFTIRTRKGTFSFFSQGELCLGVLHDPGYPAFGPGTREKLVLVARELGGMI